MPVNPFPVRDTSHPGQGASRCRDDHGTSLLPVAPATDVSVGRDRRRPCSGDQGLALLMTAIMIVVLLIMTAFAVDIGAQLAERRQDQTSADAGALAGIQSVLIYGELNVAASQAIGVVRKNLPTKYSDADWLTMWVSCTDPNPGAEFSSGFTSSGSPCVRYNVGGTRIRVKLPTQLVQASFAKVIGVNSLSTGAVAEGQLKFPGAGMLPFAIPDGIDMGGQLCAAFPAECGGSSADGLRVVDSPIVGNTQFGTVPFRNCEPPVGASISPIMRRRAALNSAMGLDHMVLSYRAGFGDRLDRCDVLFPNRLYTYDMQDYATTNPLNFDYFKNGVLDGLLRGFSDPGPQFPDGGATRLERTTNPTRQVAGRALDNRPLWDYIPDAWVTGIPDICQQAYIKARLADNYKTATGDCLQVYNGAAPGTYQPLFTKRSPGTPPGQYDAMLSPRFAVVPIVCASVTPKCPSTVMDPPRIISFRYGFIQTMYTNGSTAQFDPNPSTLSPMSAPNFTGISAFQINDMALPPEMRGATGAIDNRNAVYSLVL